MNEEKKKKKLICNKIRTNTVFHRTQGLIGTGPAQGASPLTQQYLDGWWSANSTIYVNSGVPGRSVNVFSPYSYDAVIVYANAFKREYSVFFCLYVFYIYIICIKILYNRFD